MKRVVEVIKIVSFWVLTILIASCGSALSPHKVSKDRFLSIYLPHINPSNIAYVSNIVERSPNGYMIAAHITFVSEIYADSIVKNWSKGEVVYLDDGVILFQCEGNIKELNSEFYNTLQKKQWWNVDLATSRIFLDIGANKSTSLYYHWWIIDDKCTNGMFLVGSGI